MRTRRVFFCKMKIPFKKPTLTLDQQITHLQNNGMEISDVDDAKWWLLHVSYYRLSGYWFPFEMPKGTQGPRFKNGTKFEQIVKLHEFDRTLRKLTLEAIESIEVSLRGNWAHSMALLGHGHSYLNPKHYLCQNKYKSNKLRLSDETRKSKERFIKAYRKKYLQPLPPVWMTSEILSLGSLSHWYAAIKEPSLRQQIAKPFGLDEKVFKSYIHHLSVVRNICAHHGRLWDRVFDIAARLPKHPNTLNASLNQADPKRIYNTLTMVRYSLSKTAPTYGNQWSVLVKQHISTLPHFSDSLMGCPQNWQTLNVWR